jgi:hypothetical protein
MISQGKAIRPGRARIKLSLEKKRPLTVQGARKPAELACAASSGCARNEMIVVSCGACVIHRAIFFRFERQPYESGRDEPKLPVS